jgi:hypothetical protein
VGIISALTVVKVAALSARRGQSVSLEVFTSPNLNFDVSVNVKRRSA